MFLGIRTIHMREKICGVGRNSKFSGVTGNCWLKLGKNEEKCRIFALFSCLSLKDQVFMQFFSIFPFFGFYPSRNFTLEGLNHSPKPPLMTLCHHNHQKLETGNSAGDGGVGSSQTFLNAVITWTYVIPYTIFLILSPESD